MGEIDIRGWVLECDVDATRRAYEQIPLGDPEDCACLFCRNFAAARAFAYPAAALSLYERLGIRADREAETYEAGPAGDDSRLYGGWHHFVGRVRIDPGTTLDVGGGFSLSFAEGRACARPAFGDQPLVQVEFFAKVPWVLAERPDHSS